MKASRLALVPVGLCLLARPSYALFGAGDIVFDPANVEQTIAVVEQAKAQLDRLGTLLGVSTRQLDQLLLLAKALGDPATAANFARDLGPAELAAAVRAIPGLESADVSTLLRSDGQLDAFLGQPPPVWGTTVAAPEQAYAEALTSPLRQRAGAATAGAYNSWLANRTAEDQAASQATSSADLSNALASDWLLQARRRRDNLQALAAGAAAAEDAALAAHTVAEQQGAQAQLTAGTNRILLASAIESAAAQETAVTVAAAQNQLLESAAAERRDAAVLALDGAF